MTVRNISRRRSSNFLSLIDHERSTFQGHCANLINVSRWILLLCALAAASAAPRIIEIPALAFGRDRWSVLTLANPSAMARTVEIEVYRENGERLPIGGMVSLKPGETTELRVEAKTEKARE